MASAKALKVKVGNKIHKLLPTTTKTSKPHTQYIKVPLSPSERKALETRARLSGYRLGQQLKMEAKRGQDQGGFLLHIADELWRLASQGRQQIQALRQLKKQGIATDDLIKTLEEIDGSLGRLLAYHNR